MYSGVYLWRASSITKCASTLSFIAADCVNSIKIRFGILVGVGCTQLHLETNRFERAATVSTCLNWSAGSTRAMRPVGVSSFAAAVKRSSNDRLSVCRAKLR